MGFHLSTRGAEEGVRRAEGSDQSESESDRRDCHPTASHLAPAIADFISDGKRKGYDDELEQILTCLHDTWSKECASVNEKKQNSTKQPIIIKNPIIQDGSAFTRRDLRWEAPSISTAANDPKLLPEQELNLEIGRMWFLDQEISKGGFIKILESSLVWDEQVKGTRIVTTEGLSTCMEPGRGWTITSGAWNFLKKKERWKGCEQELITTIRKEAEQMEEKEEAGYRSPTWKILRALQQVNKATRIEGEAIMSAPPLFESAGRGDLEFWGAVEGPTVIIWESLSELEKTNWLEKK